ncbi:MAG: hypothetical protein WC994_06515 [Brumimicrobium sp.]
MFFNHVVGQTLIKQKFLSDIYDSKLSHAHLLLGNAGHGGLSLTLAAIQYLLCENKQEIDSCGECNSCRMMEKLEHPDVHFTFPTVQAETNISDPHFPLWKEMILKNPYSNLNDWINFSDDKGRKPIISVHQSEQILKKLTLKSFQGGHKVSVIWMAEEMNQTCANKLLKIIEEPPKDTVFFLLAESEDKILTTILSRTQITKVPRIQPDEMKGFLQERGDFSQDLMESIISRSEGDLGVALELIDSGKTENENFLMFVDLMRNCYKKDVISMLDWATKVSQLGREEQKHFLKYGLHMMRQSLMTNYTEGKLVNASQGEEDFLKNFARFITGNNILAFNKLFSEAHYSIERNANGKLLFTNITFEVMRYIRRA